MLPGLDAPPAAPAEVAKYTVRTIMRTTPAAVPGIHFLSGAFRTLNLRIPQYHDMWSLLCLSIRMPQNLEA